MSDLPSQLNIPAILLRTGAVQFRPNEPFTFASGLKSPVYCNNRLLIGETTHRTEVIEGLIALLKPLSPEVLAGTATAGIPWASFCADRLGIPLAYIRAEAKKHGQKNALEGAGIRGKRVVVLEDLITTGGSSLRALRLCREASSRTESPEAVLEAREKIKTVVSLFSYDLPESRRCFREEDCTVFSLTTFPELLRTARDRGELSEAEIRILKDWHADPQAWRPPR